MVQNFILLSLLSFYFMAGTPAMAYIGLGPGMTMIGSFFSLIIGVVIALLMIFVLPMRMMMKKRRAKKEAEGTAAKNDNGSSQ
jgi:hypothetical protein